MSEYELTKKAFKMIQEGGAIKRYHTVRTIGSQNNAEHQWSVAAIVIYIYPDVSKKMLLYALFHDCHEIETGDIPSPVKDKYASLKDAAERIEHETWRQEMGFMPDLTFAELAVVKAADYFEAVLFADEQIKMGNRNFGIVKKRCEDKIKNLKELPVSCVLRLSELRAETLN